MTDNEFTTDRRTAPVQNPHIASCRTVLQNNEQFIENLHDVFSTTVAETLQHDADSPEATPETVNTLTELLLEGVITTLDNPSNVQDDYVVPAPNNLPDDDTEAQRILSQTIEQVAASLTGIIDGLETQQVVLNDLQARVDGNVDESAEYSMSTPRCVGDPVTDIDVLAEEAREAEDIIHKSLALSLRHGETTPRDWRI
ncbi:hypothetical protein [Salinibaculum rarum]|uniref:hypothetical protein n=1 Tax=Salinibaculum rarum TaxID=3058903 RepID=UPI00265F5CDE|nr:hypothetical protein [Salinibaculum sp. KK48]